MTEHTFEPELNVALPRRVRLRDGFRAGCALWFVRLFLLPHTLVGIGILCAALWTTGIFLAVGVFGSSYDGVIVKKDASRAVKGTKGWYVKYTYTVDGREYATEVSVSKERFAEINEGDAITVRALESSPESGPWPRVPGHWPITELGGKWIITLFWNGIMSVFLWNMYVRPWRIRRLVRWGWPTEGIIRDVQMKTGKGSTSYRINYEYASCPVDGSDGQLFSGKMTSTVKDASYAQTGHLITVLYDPNKPTRSVVYRYSDYRAAP